MSSIMQVRKNSSTHIEEYHIKAGQTDNTPIPVVGRDQNPNKSSKTCSKRNFMFIILAVSAVEIVKTILLYQQNTISLFKFICFLSALSLLVLLLVIISKRHFRYILYLLLQASLLFIQKFSFTDPPFISVTMLMYASKDTIIRTTLNFLVIHFVLIGCYVFFNWFTLSLIQNSILSAMFTFVLSLRILKLPLEIEHCKENPPSDMEELQSFIKQSSQNLTDLMKDAPVDSHDKLIDVRNTLSHIMTLATSDHLYRLKIESITNDQEEIIYLQQNYDPPFIRSFSSYNCLDDYNELEDEHFLKSIGDIWNFDSFFLDECTGKPIESAAGYMIKKYSLDKHFAIRSTLVSNFFRKVESQYLKNPYHNAVHASDVLSSYVFLIKSCGLMTYMTTIETLGGIIANVAHDIAHPGYTNRFIMNSKHPLAFMYNDISVLEMMHASKVFEILQEEDCNILEPLQEGDWVFCRKLIIDMILATDMARHFDLLGYFKTKQTIINVQRQEDRVLLYKLCIKAADIGHSAKDWNIHKKWTRGVIEEFFRQGDLEKENQLAVSMFCDRNNTNVYKSQVGFIKNISLPLFQSLRDHFASEIIHCSCVQQLVENLGRWEAKMFRKKNSYIHCNRNHIHDLFRKRLTDDKNESNF